MPALDLVAWPMAPVPRNLLSRTRMRQKNLSMKRGDETPQARRDVPQGKQPLKQDRCMPGNIAVTRLR